MTRSSKRGAMATTRSASPGGEDYLTLLERVRVGLAQAVAGRDGQNIVIVAHGGIVSVSLKDVCRDLDERIIYASPNRNCAITETGAARESRPTAGAC